LLLYKEVTTPPKATTDVCELPAPLTPVLVVFKFPPVVQVAPLYSSVAFKKPGDGLSPPKANADV
jgi:hypothetical protein